MSSNISDGHYGMPDERADLIAGSYQNKINLLIDYQKGRRIQAV